MIPELGHFALILALCMALIQAGLPLAGTITGNRNWIAAARPAAQAQFLFVLIAYLALTWAFVGDDFSVRYAATNSNSALPLAYKISAVWGGHEGSLLLWALILGGWALAVALTGHQRPAAFTARVLAVMGLISIGFLLFMLLTSNPFERLLPAAADGRDLNPLLQDIGLVLHPPMLYFGYVGFSVAFSFAIAALLGGDLNSDWARWARPWTTVAWIFLTLGITLGSWWAYYELGWGGWWFWDPVENASFMPWLVGTALIHSLAVTDKRKAGTSWTVLLAIFAFSLSLLGTFLVRSGVITSVHAFATDPGRGVFILVFLGLVIGGSLGLYAWRAPGASDTGRFSLLSRETILFSNSVLLAVASASVLLGTIYPLITDALGAGKISVGPPYFNSVFIPLMIPVALFVGVGPLVRWKQQQWPPLLARLWLPAAASLAVAVLFAITLSGNSKVQIGLGVGLAVWIVLGMLQDLRFQVRNRGSLLAGLRGLRRGYYGMLTAHIGVALFIIGVTLTSNMSIEKDLRIAPGESVEIGGYSFLFEGTHDVRGPNYVARRGTVRVTQEGRVIAVLNPEKRIYRVQTRPMTEAAIDAGLTRDLYVALGETLEDGAWTMRIYYKPFIRWLWLGGIFMAIGGLLAATDKRYRSARRTAPAASAADATAVAGASS